MYRLSLWLWVTAPDSPTRRASDLCRRRLYREDLRDEEEYFIQDNTPDVAQGLDLIISAFDATEDSVAYCIHLLCLYQEKHACSRLREGFEQDLVNAIWNIMRSGSIETRSRIGHPASVIIKYAAIQRPSLTLYVHLFSTLFKKMSKPIQTLRTIIEFQDGASLMARMAILAAKGEQQPHNLICLVNRASAIQLPVVNRPQYSWWISFSIT